MFRNYYLFWCFVAFIAWLVCIAFLVFDIRHAEPASVLLTDVFCAVVCGCCVASYVEALRDEKD